MLNSNSNKLRNKVKEYILELFEDDYLEKDYDYGTYVLKDMDKKEKEGFLVRIFWNTFQEEFNLNPYNHKRFPNFYDRMKAYLNGMALNTEYDTEKQRYVLMEWFEESENEARSFNNIEVENKYFYLIVKEICFFFRKYNIDYLN